MLVRAVFAPWAAKPAVLRRTTYDNLTVARGAKNTAQHHGSGPARRHRPRFRDADRGMNETMAPNVHTVFVPASRLSARSRHTGAANRGHGGDVSPFVPQSVAASLKTKFAAS